MGGAESKITFRQGLNELIESKVFYSIILYLQTLFLIQVLILLFYCIFFDNSNILVIPILPIMKFFDFSYLMDFLSFF